METALNIKQPDRWVQVVRGSLQKGNAIAYALGKHKGWMLEYDSKQGRRRNKWFSHVGDAMKWHDRYTEQK